MRLQNRIALITGAGRGIGAAIAHRFAQEGAHVVVTDIDLRLAEATAAGITAANGIATAQHLDVTDLAQAQRVVSDIVSRFSRLDIHVNNAGITDRAAFLTVTLEQWRRVLEINLTGAMICGQAAARAMVGAGGGRIINIASISGQRGGSGRAAYGAAKAGIINLTQVMAVELGPYNVLVNAIAPGPTDVGRSANTPAQQQVAFSRMAIARFAAPAEIAAAAVFLASDDCTMTTGHVLNVDGGFNAAGIIFEPPAHR